MKISKVARLACPILLLLLCLPRSISAQSTLDGPPSVLVVTAHPDDEALFAGLVYRLAVELGARVELALVTDGAGGYRFSTLAEPLYGKKLTDPAVARQYLAGIRKRELMEGGHIVGIRDYHFLDQPDSGYTQDPDSILTDVWDGAFVLDRLASIMESGHFDYVLTHLPSASTHGHHKSASILAIRAAASVREHRPVVLGSWIASSGDENETMFAGLPGYDITRTTTQNHLWSFDRTQGIGLDGRLNYQIVVNWLIAEHKSQGTMQLIMNRGDYEQFWLYAENPDDAAVRADALFSWIASTPE
jgi:LmbE family N-acetylglucosaminyl deacetylase